MEAYITLADAVTELDDLEEAVRVLKTAQERFKGDGTVEEALKKAEVALKQSKEINYYQVRLGDKLEMEFLSACVTELMNKTLNMSEHL